MKKVFAIIAIAAIGALFFTSCNKGGTKDDEKTAITNTLNIRGSSLPVRMCIYAIYDEFVNFDIDAGSEDAGLHGYGGFPADWIGKTTQLSGPRVKFAVIKHLLLTESLVFTLPSSPITVTLGIRVSTYKFWWI